MNDLNDLQNIDPMFSVALFLVIPIALILGYMVRIRANFKYPTDLFSISILAVILGLLVAQNRYDTEFPNLWIILFVVFYLIGYWFGRHVTDKDKLELIYIGQDAIGNIVLMEVEGEYIKHKEHGLCRLPETNGELFNQLFRGIYHKVKTNAPLDNNVLFKVATPEEVKEWASKAPYANITDELTDLSAILIEGIETTWERDRTRFLNPHVPVTTIRLARGSMVPKAKLCYEFGTMDSMNKAVERAEAETIRVKTEIIPKLPQISADQLKGMTGDSTVLGFIKEFKKWQEENDNE